MIIFLLKFGDYNHSKDLMLFRFANTITGQFYGHTHNDEFTMFYDYETNQIPLK